MADIDASYPPRDPLVLEWLAARRSAGLAAGASEAELAERWTCLHSCGMYVDDGSHVSFDDLLYGTDGAPLVRDGVHVSRAVEHFLAYQRALARFGLETAKEQPPARSVELLGAQVDLEAGRLRLAPGKRARYADLAEAMASERSCGIDELLSLLGKLNFAATMYPRGRQWLHAPWRAARAVYRSAKGVVPLSRRARRSFARWASELRDESHDGVPLASVLIPQAGSELSATIYADTAGDSAGAGFCAWTVAGDELLVAEGRWSEAEREHLLICDLELAASTFGLVALQPLTGCPFVHSFTDNTVAMAAMRITSLPPLEPCSR